MQKSSSDKERYKGTYSNLNSKGKCRRSAGSLVCLFGSDSVDKFLGLVTDYDSIVGSVGLTGDFSKFKKTDYNVEKISDLWTKKRAISSGPTAGSIAILFWRIASRFLRWKRIVNSCSWTMMRLTKGRSSMRQTRKPLTFCIHGFRQRLQWMSRFTPRRWKSILLISNSMKMPACFPL